MAAPSTYRNSSSAGTPFRLPAGVPDAQLRILKLLTTGSSIRVVGELKASPAKGQTVEVHARELSVYGTADAEKYPLQKKGHSFEFLRDIAHLRPRTNTFGAIARVRNALCTAIQGISFNGMSSIKRESAVQETNLSSSLTKHNRAQVAIARQRERLDP